MTQVWLLRASGYAIIAALGAGVVRYTVPLPTPFSELATLAVVLVVVSAVVWWSRVREPWVGPKP